MQTLSLHHCSGRRVSIAANLLFMEGLEADSEFIRSLVTWARLSPSRLAAEAGLAATTVTRAFNGTATTRISLPTREKLRARFPDFPGWDGEQRQWNNSRTVRSEVAEFGDRPLEEMFGASPLKPVPLVGTAVAMKSFDPERHIELTEVDMGDVLDHVARPASLARDNEAYALTVVGESMWPRFRSGRRVMVSPRAPIAIGDDVVVQLRGTEGDGEHRDRISVVLIKELVKRTPDHYELRQFNPDVTFKVEAERVAKIHKVLGEIF